MSEDLVQATLPAQDCQGSAVTLPYAILDEIERMIGNSQHLWRNEGREFRWRWERIYNAVLFAFPEARASSLTADCVPAGTRAQLEPNTPVDKPAPLDLKGHTPGKWEWWTSCSWRRLKSDLGGGQTANVAEPYRASDGHPDLHISKADMAIIAAAPQLLTENIRMREALEELIALHSFATYHGVGMRFNGEWTSPEDVLRRARESLNKAEGRS